MNKLLGAIIPIVGLIGILLVIFSMLILTICIWSEFDIIMLGFALKLLITGTIVLMLTYLIGCITGIIR